MATYFALLPEIGQGGPGKVAHPDAIVHHHDSQGHSLLQNIDLVIHIHIGGQVEGLFEEHLDQRFHE
jgi:hypothetical protein